MRGPAILLVLAGILAATPASSQSTVESAIRDAGALIESGRSESAIERLKTAEPASTAERARLDNALGYTFFTAGREKEAEDALRTALESAREAGDTATEIKAQNNLGLLEFTRGELSAAEEAFDSASRLGSGVADDYLEIIDLQQRASRAGELVAAGIEARLERDWATAERHYTEALEIDPDSGRILNFRGYARLRGGDLDGAAADLERAVELDPDGLFPRINLLKLACVAEPESTEPLPSDLAPRSDAEAEAYAGDGELRRFCGERLATIVP